MGAYLVGLVFKGSRLRLMFILILLLFLFGFNTMGMTVSFASEAEPMAIEELHLSVLPEYLTPDVIVSQTGLFINRSEQAFDGEIWFQIPKAVEPIAVAEFSGGIHRHYYEVIDKGDHQLIRYELTNPLEPGAKLPLMLEYRYPRFQQGGHRDISVELMSRYPVDKLTVEIKQPFRTTQFLLHPATESKSIDSEGFDLYQYNYSDLKAEQLLEFKLSYHKKDNLPSIDLTPAQEEGKPAAEQSSGNSAVAILALVFLVGLGIVLFLALRGNNTRETGRGKNNKLSSTKKNGSDKKTKKGASRQGRDSEVKEPVDEKKKLRRMLSEGKITEKNYQKLLAELEKNEVKP